MTKTSIEGTLTKAKLLVREDPVAAVLEYFSVLSRFPRNKRALDGLRRLPPQAVQAVLEQVTVLVLAQHVAEAHILVGTLRLAMSDDPRIFATEADCLMRLDRWSEALDLVQKSLKRHPDDPALVATQGWAFYALDRIDEARAALERAVALNPNSAKAQNLLGTLLLALGDKQGARQAFLAAVDQPGDQASAWHNLVTVSDFAAEDVLYDRLRETAARPDLSPHASEMLDFAMAKAADDRGDVDTSFACLVRGNARNREISGYSSDNLKRSIAILRERFDGLVPCETVLEGPRPVLIVGMPRSGTTLVEQILANHPEVGSAGEATDLEQAINRCIAEPGPLSDDAASRIAAEYRSAIASKANGEPVVIDKMPFNAFMAGYALAAMPDALVLHLERDPVATCFSNFSRRFTSGNEYSYHFDDIIERLELVDSMMATWRTHFPDRILSVPYEALTEDPRGQIGRILKFLRLSRHEACLDFRGTGSFVKTASALQVRQGIYRGSSEAWLKYADHLAPVVDRLTDLRAAHRAGVETALGETLKAA